MIFDKPKIVIFVKRQSFMIVDSTGRIHTLPIAQEVVRDLEIVNHGNFVKLISDFIKSINAVKVEAIVVFAKEVIFEKFISDPTIGAEEQDAFFNQVPISHKNLLKKTIVSQNGVNLVCANGDFIRTLKLAFKTFQIRISAVVPATIFSTSGGGNSISVSDALAISGNKQLLDRGNLISVPPPDLKSKEKDKDKLEDDKELLPENVKGKIWQNQKFQLALGVSLIVGALIIVLFGLGIVKNPFIKPKPTPSPVIQNQTGAVGKASPNSQSSKQEKQATGEATISSKEASASPVLVP